MSALNKWHEETLSAIERRLDTLLTIPSKCATLLTAMRYSSLDGGKRIRPLFTIAAGNMSKSDLDTSTTIGSAIEIIHCFSLIHDDLPIMDDDDLRRGKPTNHKVYGDAIALLSGDALHTLCFEILSSNELAISAKVKLKIINLLAKSIGLQGMVGGQAIDWLSTAKTLSLDQLQEMHLLKTGALLRAAILAGYMSGPLCNLEKLNTIDMIAQKIGLLFQVVDDIIDVTEDTETLGKTANKDISQAKVTYVSILGLDEAKRVAKQLYGEVIALLEKEVNSEQLKYLADNVYYRNS